MILELLQTKNELKSRERMYLEEKLKSHEERVNLSDQLTQAKNKQVEIEKVNSNESLTF